MARFFFNFLCSNLNTRILFKPQEFCAVSPAWTCSWQFWTCLLGGWTGHSGDSPQSDVSPTMRVNYTTYDMWCEQDSINPWTHCDVMTISHEDPGDNYHPYWYACVLGIFHINVIHSGPNSKSPNPQHINFLFVRWFGHDSSYAAGWEAQCLHHVGFLPPDMLGAFGFLNPAEVIQGVHMIPAFVHGQVDRLGKSIARRPQDEDRDWRYFYIGMWVLLIITCTVHLYISRFVDHDMFMQFWGGGIGHKSTQEHTWVFEQQFHNLPPETDEALVVNGVNSEQETNRRIVKMKMMRC